MKKSVLFFVCFFIFTCRLQAGRVSAPTDYFRTIASGEWNDILIWESSPDNTNWFPATSWPGSAANTISIRNTHYVNVSNNQDMDQVVIENGGVLSHLGSTLTIMDGPGDDMIVQNGGAFTLASDGNAPVFSPASATVNINTGGTLRLSATGLTFPGVGVNASNYVYSNASVLEYTLSLAFATFNVTYFPNVNAATIPIFRIINNVGLVGAGTTTTFNGVFEANGNITFEGAGLKIFRNGITGTGTVTARSTAPVCGKFIINGVTASLGGTGVVTLNTNGMEIGPGSTVTMLSDKSVTGNIALLSNALITLGNNNLTMTGDITGGSATSHVVTNGSGKLVINNITGATPRIFPIGATATTINPLAIFNGGGLNYGARVEIGLNPAIAIPVSAVNRTWIVKPSGTPAGTVNVNFFYSNVDGNAMFNYAPATVEQGFYTTAWNVINSGLTQFGGPVNFQVTGTVNIFAANTDAPMVIANLGAILTNSRSVSVDYFTGIKQNSNHLLKWKLTCNNTATVNMVIERSTDASNYHAIYTEHAAALRCEQPFSFTDNQPAPGVNFYRIKITDDAGKITYSSIVSLINAAKGIDVLNIAPNPIVNGSFNLQISAAEKMPVQIIICDMQGRIMQKQNAVLIAGFNSIPVHVKTFAKGSYQLFADTAAGRTRVLRFVVQ